MYLLSPRYTFIKKVLIAVAIACAGNTPTLSHASPQNRIVLIRTRNIPFYAPAVDGFIKGLDSRGYSKANGYSVDVLSLTGDRDRDDDLMRSAVRSDPPLLVTLGTDATLLCAGNKPTSPILFSMILNPVTLGLLDDLNHPGGDATGTTILVSPGKQFESLLQACPNIKSIGVLYTDGDKTSLALIDNARHDAIALGLQLDALAIKDPKTDIKRTLSQARGKFDALWLIPDPASTGPDSFVATMEFANVSRIPVLGSSEATVKAGALLALSANIKDLGDVTAEMAGALLEGNVKAGDMRIRGPRQTTLSINLITANDLGIRFPTSLLHLADNVVDGK